MTTKSKTHKILAKIVRAGLFEDRLEYSVDMLATMYSLCDEEAEELYLLIHANV